MIRTLIRWTTGIDVIAALEREQARTNAAWNEADRVNNLRRQVMAERDKALADRDAARDQITDLTAELATLRKTNAMFRSLIGILRDVNRELDERNTYLEKLHGMTPGERLEAIANGTPDRCTENKLEAATCHQ